jgi:membrane AbrB-like protein
MFAGLLAALIRAPLAAPPKIGDAMRTVLGVAVGASITPELLGRLPEMAYSVALVPVMVLTVGLVGVPYFLRICKFDWPTAYYCAMPGGLQDMLLLGEEAGGNPRALSLVHATRVLAIVAAMPLLVTLLWDRSLTAPPGAPAIEVAPTEMLIMLVCAAAGWAIAARIKLFGATILGPMILATIASLTGLLHTRPPAEAILAAQFFIGLAVGVKYRGVTLSEIRNIVFAALGFCVILTVIAIAFAELVVTLDFAGPIEAFLAFAPGGQGEMVVLAIVAGADMAFVVTHHLIRLIVVIPCAPIFAKLLGDKR